MKRIILSLLATIPAIIGVWLLSEHTNNLIKEPPTIFSIISLIVLFVVVFIIFYKTIFEDIKQKDNKSTNNSKT